MSKKNVAFIHHKLELRIHDNIFQTKKNFDNSNVFGPENNREKFCTIFNPTQNDSERLGKVWNRI